MAPAGSQQLLAQDSAPDRRCYRGENRAHQERKEGTSDDGNKDKYGNEHEGRNEGENGSENGDEGGGDTENGNLRSCNRGRSEDAGR